MQWVSNNKNVERTGITATKLSQKKQRDNGIRDIRYTPGQVNSCENLSLLLIIDLHGSRSIVGVIRDIVFNRGVGFFRKDWRFFRGMDRS